MPDGPENFSAANGVKRLRRRTIFGVILGIIACGAGVGLVFGFGLIGQFLKTGPALLSETLGDVFYGSGGNNSKLSAEIDLSAGNLASGTGASTLSGGIFAGNSEKAPVPPVSSSENKKTGKKESGQTSGETAAAGKSKGASAQPASAASLSKKINPVPACDFASAGSPTRKIIFNEIAWMGSPLRDGESATKASQSEWMELKNNSDGEVDLAGWQIMDDSEKFNIVFSDGDKVAKSGLYLLERTDDDSVPGIAADKIYTGALPNSGEWLRVFDDGCTLVDEINASAGWPGGDNVTKQTLERTVGDFSWHTSLAPGGTPKAENSAPIAAAVPASTTASGGLPLYDLGVSIQGGGTGIVSSSPAGIYCGFDCSELFPAGTKVSLSATPDANSVFENWSGACAGAGDCAIVVTGTLSVAANFESNVPEPPQNQ